MAGPLEPLASGSAVIVRVPASSANLGPGFDSIGLALGLWDECEARVTDSPGLVIEVEGEGADLVPRDERHLVHRTMLTAWEQLGVQAPEGLHLRCHNAVPHGRGLGSSATAIVTGIVAAQGIHNASRKHDDPLDLGFTNSLASRLEGHPDNASASVYGGMTLSWCEGPGMASTTTVPVPLHPDLAPVVFVPREVLSTATARSVLPSQVRLADAAANSGRAALLVHAIRHEPRYLLAATREWLHQEARRESFAPSMALVDRLRSEGHAAVISGAGPSVLVLATTSTVDEVVRHGGDGVWQALCPGVPERGATVRRVTNRVP